VNVPSFSIAAEPLDEAGRQAVVVIRAGRLHVRVVLVEAEVDEAGLRLVIPLAVALPELRGARLERHAIDRHAEERAIGRRRPRGDAWRERAAEDIVLRADRVRVAAARKIAGLVIGDAVRADGAEAVALDRDGAWIGQRRERGDGDEGEKQAGHEVNGGSIAGHGAKCDQFFFIESFAARSALRLAARTAAVELIVVAVPPVVTFVVEPVATNASGAAAAVIVSPPVSV
jgi:hypothetical protein